MINKKINILKFHSFFLQIKGVLVNTGQDLKLVVKETDTNPFIFTGGPLSYQYTLFEIKLHFGDNNSKGSEHSIGGKKFPLEVIINIIVAELTTVIGTVYTGRCNLNYHTTTTTT
jgi:hypothetical protein